jgi:adenosylcobinamide-GDP ribazoletransferase
MTTALTRSLGLFTIAPVRGDAALGSGEGVRALLWLPALGFVVGGFAALPAAAVRHWSPHANLLGSVAAVGLLAVLTRGLHWDGLADTADGLGSQATPERALEIMRQSDIGPFGVLSLVFVALAEVAALSAVPGPDLTPVALLGLAAATGRVAAVDASRRGIPTAPGSGFGALVAGGVTPLVSLAWTFGVLALGAGTAVALSLPITWIVGPQAVALVIAYRLRRHVVRRLTGISGDVFGALIETATALTLVGAALR